MNVLRASKVENIPCEEQAKFVQERLLETEEWLSKISSAFNLYAKKSVRLRDATDGLAIILNEYAAKERINKSMKSQVLLFADLVASLGDLRDHKIHQMQSNILNQFCQYSVKIRNTKAQVKGILNVKEKEVSKRKQLGKIRTLSPYNRDQIVKAEAALSAAISNVSQAQRELEESALKFEKKKIQDLKAILLEFVLEELSESSKSIQILTQAFKEIQNISVQSDLEDFSGVLKINPLASRLEAVKSHSTVQPVKVETSNSGRSSVLEESETISEENSFSENIEKLSLNYSEQTTT